MRDHPGFERHVIPLSIIILGTGERLEIAVAAGALSPFTKWLPGRTLGHCWQGQAAVPSSRDAKTTCAITRPGVAGSADLTTAKSDLRFYCLWRCMPRGKGTYRCKG